MLPFGGTLVAAALVGDDIRRKGVLRGSVNSGLDMIPVFGLAKNAVELFTGDLIPTRPRRTAKQMVLGSIFKGFSFVLVTVVLFSAFTADAQTRTKRKSRTLMTSQVQPPPRPSPRSLAELKTIVWTHR
jgi:hypothetical protein